MGADNSLLYLQKSYLISLISSKQIGYKIFLELKRSLGQKAYARFKLISYLSYREFNQKLSKGMVWLRLTFG